MAAMREPDITSGLTKPAWGGISRSSFRNSPYRRGRRFLALLILVFSAAAQAESIAQPTITLIIDDIGNSYDQGHRAVMLPGAVTYSVLPHSTYGAALAKIAHRQGKEVMLHMPMSNEANRPLGPGGLTSGLNQYDFEQRLDRAISAVPHIRGLNNHMGSRLTQNLSRMQWLMQAVKRYPLYFVDSRTSPATVAASVASDHRIPTLTRDVFLDNDPSPIAIDYQFRRLLRIARQQGSAVAIGHPYASTLGYLENVLPKLDALGVRLVSPSGLLRIKQVNDDDLEQGNRSLISVKAEFKKDSATADSTVKKLAPPPGNNTRHCRLDPEGEITRVYCDG